MNMSQKYVLFIFILRFKILVDQKLGSYLDVSSRYKKIFLCQNHNRERTKLEQNFTNSYYCTAAN